MTTTELAKVCHEVNRAFCQGIGDDSQPSWEQAPEWQKQSSINNVVFHFNFPEASPSASHENWLKDKVDSGWTYGAIKDPTKKQHPCMVPFDMLPPEQRAKDVLFKTVCNHLSWYLD